MSEKQEWNRVLPTPLAPGWAREAFFCISALPHAPGTGADLRARRATRTKQEGEQEMLLYNSATHKKEEFVPNHPDIVKMYTCGPTVYHFAHIGNLRSYIMEDVLE